MIRRVALLAALTLTVTAGCAGDGKEPAAAPPPSPTAAPTAAGAPWYDDVAPAEAGTTVGATDSTCPLPITFSVPPKWKVEAVTVPDARIGNAVMRCEFDAKPAGHIGFMRAWRIEGSAPTPQATMERFLEAYGTVREPRFRRLKAGSLDAFEAAWTGDDAPGRAILVDSRPGPVLLTLGAIDDEEFEAMFPAYQLAKGTAELSE
ncbi:lipoprotein [Micromonospora psammae]|uniref:lipoprotein n=1 Tax=Micromonospora sp. CPCC 205556 TaxID=3122398 RepID=UPI002FF38828